MATNEQPIAQAGRPELSQDSSGPAVTLPAVVSAQRSEIAKLTAALESSRVIGAATGIIMQAYDVTYERAFDALTRTSATRPDRLRDLAAEIVLTRDASFVRV